MEEIRRLVIKAFHIKSVKIDTKTYIQNETLCLNCDFVDEIAVNDPLVDAISVSIIEPGKHNIETNTIMDIVPISTKVLGVAGEGITHTLTGVYVLLTGSDADGKQMHEFGSSEGILSEHLVYGKAGTPDVKDILIHIDVTLVGGMPYERSLPFAAFKSSDLIIQAIREKLKQIDGTKATEVHEFYDRKQTGKTRVAIVKQIAGQGAMYDNQLFSHEPSGIIGGISNIDMMNMPMVLSPNEYRDGILRSMT